MPAIAFWTCIAAVLIVWARYLVLALKAAKYSGIIIESGENSNSQAKESFLRLIEAANHSLETFDDGDKETESIYESNRVVNAIIAKLDANPDFKLVCYFNAQADDLLFYQRLHDRDRVNINRGLEPVPSERPENELHYKIVDDGRLVYVSHHAFSEQDRDYWIGDGRHLPEKHVKAKAKLLYAPMREHVQSKLSAVPA